MRHFLMKTETMLVDGDKTIPTNFLLRLTSTLTLFFDLLRVKTNQRK